MVLFSLLSEDQQVYDQKELHCLHQGQLQLNSKYQLDLEQFVQARELHL